MAALTVETRGRSRDHSLSISVDLIAVFIEPRDVEREAQREVEREAQREVELWSLPKVVPRSLTKVEPRSLREVEPWSLREAEPWSLPEAELWSLPEAELKLLREAVPDAWFRHCYDTFKPGEWEEGARALIKKLIEERIRYLESVEERRREEALVRRSLSPSIDYLSPDLNMLSPRMYGRGLTDAEQVPEKTPGRLSFGSMRRCSPDRDMLILPNTDVALVTDSWSCSLGSERTLGYPRVYGNDLKDYVEQVPDSRSGDSERTLYPYVTGTSVLAVKFRDGILMAADMGGSYGSTLRYKTIERIKPIGKHSLLGASGEISDFQEILRYLDELILHDNMWEDGNSLGPKEVHNYLTRVMYNRRNKFNPLWNSLVLGGVKNGQKYLGMVSMIGLSFEENHVATGFGNHLAQPILRDEWNENLSFEDGVKLLEKCIRVLLYRDRSAVNKLQIVKITEEGATNFPPYSLKTFWGFESYENPTVGEEGPHLKMTNENKVG